MRPPGRSAWRVVASAPRLLSAVIVCAIRFREPWRLLLAYLRGRTLAQRCVRLRSGMTIRLSDDPLDVATVFGVFARESYGKIGAGSTVVDVGANIGVFSLFAVYSGAAKVHAYEPCAESFDILQQNIADNGLASTIEACRSAVVGLPRGPVRFPRSSNVFNTILPDGAVVGTSDEVDAVTLATVLARTARVDLLKMDCEGAEFECVPNTPAKAFGRVAAVKLQYHAGPRDLLISAFADRGFRVRQIENSGDRGGYAWLTCDGRETW